MKNRAPAHPTVIFDNEQAVGVTPGLTKREYAAIQIMAARFVEGDNTSADDHPDGYPDFSWDAKMAVAAADALLAELGKK